MFRLKEITEHSWIVQGEDNSHVGLLSEYNNKLTLLVQGGDNKAEFKGRDEARELLGEDIFDNLITVTEKSKENFVNGYPVDFEDPYEITLEGEDLPLYSKTEAGNVPYCAGYYIIHFNKGPMPAHCPKLKTLQDYGYDGPFKTEMEMKTVLSQIKKRARTN